MMILSNYIIYIIDLRASEVDCLTLGQYMRPTRKHMKVSINDLLSSMHRLIN
jgi:lipoate synthase